MTKIYITRHGETEWNREHKFQGNKDSKLTEEGILTAELLANRMEDIDLDYIISSPLMRAYRTSEIIKGEANIEIIKEDGLKEINLGAFEGMRYDDIKKEYPDQLARIEKDPFNNSYPKGENLKEFYNRVITAFKKIIENHKNKTILLVAHGGTIKCLETYIKNLEISKDWMGNIVENCSLSYFEVDENNEIKEIFYNDTKHLEVREALN